MRRGLIEKGNEETFCLNEAIKIQLDPSLEFRVLEKFTE